MKRFVSACRYWLWLPIGIFPVVPPPRDPGPVRIRWKRAFVIAAAAVLCFLLVMVADTWLKARARAAWTKLDAELLRLQRQQVRDRLYWPP
jgi:hypothetical protein